MSKSNPNKLELYLQPLMNTLPELYQAKDRLYALSLPGFPDHGIAVIPLSGNIVIDFNKAIPVVRFALALEFVPEQHRKPLSLPEARDAAEDIVDPFNFLEDDLERQGPSEEEREDKEDPNE